MSTKVVEKSTKLRLAMFECAGNDFRQDLEACFPLHGRETRSQWFYRLGRATGIRSNRLSKLSYDERCAVKAHELRKIQQAVSAQSITTRQRAETLARKQRILQHDAFQEFMEVYHHYAAHILERGDDVGRAGV